MAKTPFDLERFAEAAGDAIVAASADGSIKERALRARIAELERKNG